MPSRSMCALFVVVAGCGQSPESSSPRAETIAVTPAPSPAAASASAPAAGPAPAPSPSAEPSSSPPPASSAPALDVATCAQNAPPGSKCKWSLAAKTHCSGAAPPPRPRPERTEWQCVCNGCESDADCTAKAGGKCQPFSRICGPTAMACVYPGDLCAANGGCAKKTFPRGGSTTYRDPGQCSHDGAGHAVCGAMPAPPPASRPVPRGEARF